MSVWLLLFHVLFLNLSCFRRYTWSVVTYKLLFILIFLVSLFQVEITKITGFWSNKNHELCSECAAFLCFQPQLSRYHILHSFIIQKQEFSIFFFKPHSLLINTKNFTVHCLQRFLKAPSPSGLFYSLPLFEITVMFSHILDYKSRDFVSKYAYNFEIIF